MFRFFFSFFFFLIFFQVHQLWAQQTGESNQITNDFSLDQEGTNNVTNVSRVSPFPDFDIDNLTNEGVYFINTNDSAVVQSSNLFEIKDIVLELVEQTNQDLIEILYPYLETNSFIKDLTNRVIESLKPNPTNLLNKDSLISNIGNIKDLSELSNVIQPIADSFVHPDDLIISRGVLLYLLTNETPYQEYFDISSKFSILSLLPQIGILDDLELLNADNISLYKKKEDHITNTIIVLRGNVEFKYDETIIKADEVRLNLQTQDTESIGNIYISLSDQNVITGERLFLNIKKQQGVILSAVGRQDKNYYLGKILRFNDKDFYTIENAKVSFSSDGHPFYSIGFNRFDYLGDEDINATQLVYKVHNHPFLWFPSFLQNNNISTSLKFNFGQNRREGYYLLNNYIFDFSSTNTSAPIDVNLNLFEKVGTYLDLKQARTVGDHSYDLFLSGGLYYQNINVTRAPLLYSFHDPILYSEEIRDGYQINYQHTYTLIRSESGVSSSIQFDFIQNSNPFFGSIFRKGNIFPEFDLSKLYQRDENEAYYVGTGLNKDRYSIDYILSAPAFSISVSSSWIYDIYEDPEELEFTEERYISYLKTWYFPNINIGHNASIPLFKLEDEKYFELGYSLSSSFNGVVNYKDGEELGVGSLYTNVEPYEIINSEYDFGFNFGVSKSFSFNPEVDTFWYWVQSSLSSSLNWNYRNAFEVQKNDTTYIPRKNQETKNITIGLGNNNSFLDNIGSPLGMNFNQSFTWTLGDFYTRDDFNFDVDRSQLSGTNTSYIFSANTSWNLPSLTLRNNWQSAYGLKSLIPYLNLNANYQLSKYTTLERTTNIATLYDYDRFSEHHVNGGGDLNHNGKNFLFIDGLDTVNSVDLNFSYNLKPEVSNEMELPVVLDEKRIQNLTSGYSFSMNYKDHLSINNSLAYILFDNATKTFTNYLENNNFGLTLAFKDIVDNWVVKVASLNASYNWAYFFRENQYTSDSMSVSFSSSLSLFKGLFSMSAAFSLANSKAYLYFPDKASFLGGEAVNIFEDIANTVGLAGIENLEKGLFKINNFSISLSHDLREWYLSFNYSISPVNVVNSGSLKGFYFDQRISLDINLKPEYNPSGTDRFIPVDPINEDLSPDVLR